MNQPFETTSLQKEGLSEEKFKAALHALGSACGSDDLQALVVIKNGKILWQGREAHRLFDIYSCTKSITSLAFGILLDEGACSLDTLAADFIPEMRLNYSEVRLKHFASMTSGYNAIGGRYGVILEDGTYNDGSETPHFLSAPLFSPGSLFHYNDDAMRMFGLVLEKLSGRSLSQIFQEKVADRIGLKRWYWSDYIGNNLGTDSASTFITSAMELAKIGYLYLHLGKWQDQRIVSEAWVSHSTHSRTLGLKDYAGSHYRNIAGGEAYGMGWWSNGPKGSVKHMDALPKESYYASGFNNNKMWVIPKWDMVIVRLGADGMPRGSFNGFFEVLADMIGGN